MGGEGLYSVYYPLPTSKVAEGNTPHKSIFTKRETILPKLLPLIEREGVGVEWFYADLTLAMQQFYKHFALLVTEEDELHIYRH